MRVPVSTIFWFARGVSGWNRTFLGVVDFAANSLSKKIKLVNGFLEVYSAYTKTSKKTVSKNSSTSLRGYQWIYMYFVSIS